MLTLTGFEIPKAWIIGIIVAIGIILIFSIIFSMWRKVPQDKAAVVTGLHKRIITGGGGLVIPVLERVDTISLGNIQLDVTTDESMSSQGVPIAVVGTAVIKVKNEANAIFNAIEQFTGRNETEIERSIRDTATNVLEGKLREIVSTMTVEEIYRDRETFSAKVQEVVGTELMEMGLEVKVFTIKDINDSNGYIQALGVKQIVEKKKDAEIAKAEANREAQIETSKARRAGEQARLQLWMIMTTYMLCGMMDVCVGSIRGMGYSVMPTIVSLIGACFLRLVWLWTVFPMPDFHNASMIYITYPISWAITFSVHLICFLVLSKKYKEN